ncbi:hypothetical protein M3611_26875 [Priestia megaterium]|uniref:hypothetical protein n=1 Tax=Priestia megaterium TaxID=1404 RepID=UPI00203FB296|nr:hypothetical protein [Priestia megaterium]MCM3155620.1 hypothetical protein [Priestia megaterium]
MQSTTNHAQVVLFNSKNGEETFKDRKQVNSLKKHYIAIIEDQMAAEGVALTKAQKDILGLLVYNTCVTGVQSISLSKLVDKSGYSRATVARAKKAICELGFFSVGYLGDEQKGHYVFVLKAHKNHDRIMQFLFNDNSCDNSNETSSKAETPCESKAEGQEKVPTFITLNTLNNSLNNKKEIGSIDNIINMPLGKEFIPSYVPEYFINSAAPYMSVTEVEELYTITVRTFNKYSNTYLVLENMEQDITESLKATIFKVKQGKVKATYKDIKQFYIGVFKNKISVANRKSAFANANGNVLFTNFLDQEDEEVTTGLPY